MLISIGLIKFKVYLAICLVFLLCIFSQNKNLVYGKTLDIFEDKSCENVKQLFDILNITSTHNVDKTGDVCNGQCCDNKIESDLMLTSINNFEKLLRDHTSSLLGLLDKTSNEFRDHVLELSRQSENRTLSLFSQVYRRMAPISRYSVLELYDSIRSQISTKHMIQNLDAVVKKFFINLFPVAYHHVVDTNNENSNGDFHIDYKNCLEYAYDQILPFGEIPKQLSRSITQSVSAATVFLKSLDQAALILKSTEELYTEYLSPKCKTHLLKLSYCPACKGISHQKVKTCSAYCLNVMRGCLTHYVESLDSPWSRFAISIERLMHLVRSSKDGIEAVVKTLDTKLSEAIMYAMGTGPSLQKEVKKSCGTPSLLPSQTQTSNETSTTSTAPSKWVSPPDTEMLHFLARIDESKDLFSKIIDNLCKDESFKKDDKNCWTGAHIGEYSQPILSTSVTAQKYNPEVPYETTYTLKLTKLSELSDKLIDLQRQVAKEYSQIQPHSDFEKMLSDMAEGSGWNDDSIDDLDDYGSGSGAGKDQDAPRVVDVSSMDTSRSANIPILIDKGTTPSFAHKTRISYTILVNIIIINFISNFYSTTYYR